MTRVARIRPEKRPKQNFPTGNAIYAASSSTADVQTAVDSAVTGDRVYVPASGATWSSAVTVSKAISIIGTWNGTTGTTLTGSGALANGFFHVTNVTSSTLLRISGFRFVMSGATQTHAIHVMTAVSLSALRIDHNRFDEGAYQIEVGGATGVIDHNAFYNADVSIYFTAGSDTQARASWASMAAGTSAALFIEDNTFIDDADYPLGANNEKIGTYNGGKLVVRYNEFDFDDFPLAVTSIPVQTHGSHFPYWQRETTGRRGQSVVELYNNTAHGPRIDFLAILRGSANLVHDNAITGTVLYAPQIRLMEEEATDSSWTLLRTVWPAEDQVHNSFFWSNTYNGGAHFDESGDFNIGASEVPFIQLDRDFFLHAPASSGGKASFTGLNGGSNTYPTNGSTYPTLGNMTFSASGANEYYGYTPYTYPHPLTVL